MSPPPFLLVPETGLEPARIAPPPPQGGVSTNFTTPADLLDTVSGFLPSSSNAIEKRGFQ